jgi:hypothetical protein
MFNRVAQLAERVATGMSRRQFVSWMGRGGLALAAVVVGVGASSRSKCVLNGGCCSGPYPYARMVYYSRRRQFVQNGCYSDAQCFNGGLCAPSACCNGGGTCFDECYSDSVCSTPCS